MGMSDNDQSSADPFGQIADEFVAAFRAGKQPSIEEFVRRYPPSRKRSAPSCPPWC
jgi:hypothetical protein